MKILFISSFLIFKETHFGGVKRMYYFAREMSKSNEVDIISMDACQELSKFKEGDNEFKNFLIVENNPDTGSIRQRLRGIDISHYLGSKQEILDRFLKNRSFDVALLAYPLALSFIGTHYMNGAKRVVYIEDDIFFETAKRDIFRLKNPLKKLIKLFRWLQLNNYYRNKLKEISRFIAISKQEGDIIKSKFPWLDISIIKYGAEPQAYPLIPTPQDKHTIGFIGNFMHYPNPIAVDYFLKKIFPYIKQRLPEIKFFIAGRNMPPGLKLKYSKVKDVCWMGDVHDLKEFYKHIYIFIVPVVNGRGLRTKIIESAAFGRPVISTQLGAEGLADFKIDIVHNKEGYINAVSKLLKDYDYYDNVRNSNRKCFEEKYTIAAVTAQLLNVLRHG